MRLHLKIVPEYIAESQGIGCLINYTQSILYNQ